MGIERFAEGPPDAALADEIAGLGEAALLALVEALVAAGRRAHLELLGRPAFPKAVRKAAGRAVYKLRSAGVGGETAARSGPAGLAVGAAVALDEVALVCGPGLAARYWMVCAELPGAEPVAVETGHWVEEALVRLPGRLSVGKIRHYRHEMGGAAEPSLPIVADAALAVRMIDRVAAALRARGGAFPQGWSEVLWWRERAVALGADPEAADARRLVGEVGEGRAEPGGDLLAVPHAGQHLPEQAAIDALLGQVVEAVGKARELTRAELVDRLEGLADASCDAYYGRPGGLAVVALALEGSADVLAHHGARGGGAAALGAAGALLALADEVAAGARLPHEIAALARSFRRIIDYERAWDAVREGADVP